MGRTLLRLANDDPQLSIVGGLEPGGSPFLGGDVGQLIGVRDLGVQVTDDPLEAIRQAEGIIDFSHPSVSAEIAGYAAQARIVHVIGTTGFSAEQEDLISAAARHATIVKSGNMSLGVNLLTGLVETAAAALGSDWDIEVLDMHHRHKIDSPSGTALLLGEAAATGRDINLNEFRDSGRDGICEPRATGAIGFAALRGGSVVGDHEVIFAGEGEQIRLVHRAESRDIFAAGALKAALWAKQQSSGLFSMRDVLGLTSKN